MLWKKGKAPRRRDLDSAEVERQLARAVDEFYEDLDTRWKPGRAPPGGSEAGDLLTPRLPDEPAPPSGPRSPPRGVPPKLGEFRIVSELGRGGMGAVYEAVQEPLERRVALKVLSTASPLTPGSTAVARFEREARAAARLRHPNIVEIHSLGLHGDVPYFAMEFVEGSTLHQLGVGSTTEIDDGPGGAKPPTSSSGALLAVSRRLLSGATSDGGSPTPSAPRPRTGEVVEAAVEDETPSRQADLRPNDPTPGAPTRRDLARIALAFAGVAEGLHHAHSHGVIHRDVKPSNLILDSAGTLRILDFGLAWVDGLEQLTLTREALGTPRYMSPEQAQPGGAPLTPSTDIYSLGVTLYELLVGRPPFHGKTVHHTLEKIVRESPPAPRRLQPRLPRDLELILLQCLRKEPRNRYPTALALAEDLRAFAEGRWVRARSPSLMSRTLMRARRAPGKVLALASIGILLAGVTWLSVRYELQARLVRNLRYAEEVTAAIGLLHHRFPGAQHPGARSVSGAYSQGFFQPSGTTFADPIDFQKAVTRTAKDRFRDALARLDEAVRIDSRRADAYYHRARAHTLSGRPQAALGELDTALERDSSFVPALALRAAILEEAGDKDGAQEALRRARRAATNGWAEAWLEAHQALARADWERARTAYLSLETLGHGDDRFYLGSSIEILLGLGVVHLELDERSEAIRYFAKAEGRWPALVEPSLLLGKAYLLDGKEQDAKATFDALYAREEKRDEIALGIAHVYCALDRNEEGKGWASRIRDAALRNEILALFHVKLGSWQEARAAADEAILLEPEAPLAHLWLGLTLLVGLDRPTEAAAALEEASRLDPTNPMAFVWLGDALAKDGQLEAALGNYEVAATLDPESPWPRISLGVTLERMERLDEAFDQYVAAFERDPTLTAVYQHLDGLLRRDKGPPPGAPLDRFVTAMEAVLDRGGRHPLLPDLLRILALSLVDHPLGAYQARAARYASLAIERTNRRQPRMLSALAQVQFAQGDPPGAIRTLEEAAVLPHWSRLDAQRLDEYRGAARPDLVSFASIDAALADLDTEVLLAEGASWRFFRGEREPSETPLEWTKPEFDDSSWEEGPVGIGFGDGDDRTELPDMKGNYSTVYTRREFHIPDPERFGRLVLSVRVDDGFVAYLNGLEIRRIGVRPERIWIPFDGVADAVVSVEPPFPFEVPLERSHLRRGRNVLALQGLNSSVNSSDLSLLPVLRRELEPSYPWDQALLDELVREGRERSEACIAYLEGRVLQRAGRLEEAIGRLEEAASREGARPEPVVRIAECLVSAGRAEDAERRLRSALEGEIARHPAVWDLWLETCFLRLERKPAEILARFPTPAGGAALGSDPTSRRAAEVRWLLERLEHREPIRINCGGAALRGWDGEEWGRDSFYLSGCRFGEQPWSPLDEDDFPAIVDEIAETEDDILYQTERWFPTEDSRPAGYRVPLYPGRYAVTLHVAEVFFHKPGERAFDVDLEGRPFLRWYQPISAGFATRDLKRREVEVHDGFLDLELFPQIEHPKLSALEIEPLP